MKDRWEILANYLVQGIVQTKIAQILGVSDATVSVAVNDPEFQEYYTAHLKKVSASQNDFDDGWDGLEKLAVGNLIGLMKLPGVMFDPKLNLQIAMVSNKAQRRLSRFNNPLDAAAAGSAPVVINLQTNYINKIQQNTQINAPDSERDRMLTGQRVQNMPSPTRIEQMLATPVLDNGDTIMEQADALMQKVKVA